MSDFTYELVKHVAVLSDSGKTWRKELNIIKWGISKPKYDLRIWTSGNKRMGKGISLYINELSSVVELLHKHLNDLEQSQVGTLLGDPKYNCKLCKECGVIAKNIKGWTIEVNIMKWGKNTPSFDVRSWGPVRSVIGKGITLNRSEAEALITAFRILSNQRSNAESTQIPNYVLHTSGIDSVINDLFI